MDLCAGWTFCKCIIKNILATSLRFTFRILNTGVVYFILIVDRTNYICSHCVQLTACNNNYYLFSIA